MSVSQRSSHTKNTALNPKEEEEKKKPGPIEKKKEIKNNGTFQMFPRPS